MGPDRSRICFGDSGGFLGRKVNKVWYVEGLSSFVYGRCEDEINGKLAPAMFTEVTYYINLINFVMNTF